MEWLKTVTGNVSKYSSVDFGNIHRWFKYHEKCILSRQQCEDDFSFPAMFDKQPNFKIQIDAMEHVHVAFDTELNKLNTLII